MATFWKLLEQSVIVQALVTLALTASVVYLAVTSQPVPEALQSLTLISLGYYFGSKTQLTGRQAGEAAVAQLLGIEGKDHDV